MKPTEGNNERVDNLSLMNQTEPNMCLEHLGQAPGASSGRPQRSSLTALRRGHY